MNITVSNQTEMFRWILFASAVLPMQNGKNAVSACSELHNRDVISF